ncbi:hypothetical protein F2Z80_25020 [Vibrio fortis]|uniref:Uncharacterized protein n=1 Tax=Vibrio fortis TaxID=212667 RepID=A0A5N3S351_9VIBR|nr:hypothetical protein [Vibrio fortis]KAB0300341.1 hypothetical protein F2Z80_25020 [Vibrio fortis]
MSYRWARFRQSHSFLGAAFELFIVALCIFSLGLPFLSESLFTLQISSALLLFCFVLMFTFARSEKLRRSMH